MSRKNQKKHEQQKKSSLPTRKVQNHSGKTSPVQEKTLAPQTSFQATLTMLTDWHIGSGTGRPGDVDRLVQRDKEKLPFVPAKTLTGIWRDACELVALSLDEGRENGNWGEWINYLFGDQPALANGNISIAPRPAALSVRAAHLPDELCQALRHTRELKDALTFVKPGISIDPSSGCAREDYLRFEEMARGGAVLQARCELNFLGADKGQQKTAYALLLAGAKLVERLGGKRRRGAGKCQLIIEANINPWIDWIEAHLEEPPMPPSLAQAAELSNTVDIQAKQDNTWLAVKLNITTRSPVTIAARTVGNVVETLDYIPGTHLLPIITKKLGSLHGAIARGDLVITNATVEVNGQQGRPVPLALFYEKLGGGLEKSGKIYNRFVQLEPDGQLKGERGGYISSTNVSHLPKYAKVNLSVETHNTIRDDVQRPTSDIGGVYSYQAIESGTKLQAELRLRQGLSDALGKSWWKALDGEVRLGQSKKDDYGAVLLKVQSEPIQIPKTDRVGTELTLWLLSNVLLRDERLRPTASIEHLAKELGQVLGVKLILKKPEDGRLSCIARQQRIDSWQVRWGLPRPSLVGLAAGTCVVFTVEGTLDHLKLAQIQASGIGERRAEGYGQVCFNDPILTSATPTSEAASQQKSQTPESKQSIAESDRAFSYARIVEKAAWQEAIRRASLFLATNEQSRFSILGIKIIEEEDKKVSKPPMSQLGALRSVLVRLKSPADQAVTKWIQHLRDTRNRAEKWPEGSLDTINKLMTSPSQVWTHLAEALQELQYSDFSKLTLTQSGEQDLKGRFKDEWEDGLWSEAVRTLVDACIRAHKRDLENQLDIIQESGEELHGA